MANCTPIDTPFANGLKLTFDMSPQTHEEKQEMDDVPYQTQSVA